MRISDWSSDVCSSDLIRRSIGSLATEASGLVTEIQSGVEQSSRAVAQFETITDALHDATHLVPLLDDHTDRIAQSSALVHATGARVLEACGRLRCQLLRNSYTMARHPRTPLNILPLSETVTKY